MIELEILPVCVIFFGLGLDVVGAILIISPLMNLAKQNYPRGDPSKLKQSSFGFTDMKHGYDQDVRTQNRAWWGLGFLISGFAFQGLGSWYLNPPF